MKDETKEIKINLPLFHFKRLQVWAFGKSITYSQLASNIIQARCEDKGNYEDMEAILKLRASQSPYLTTVEDLRRRICGDDEGGDKVAVPIDTAAYNRLHAIAFKQNKTVAEYIERLEN